LSYEGVGTIVPYYNAGDKNRQGIGTLT